MGKPVLVGITGGIGSGKSTVCRIFHQLGMPIYYADDRGKFLLNNNDLLRNQVVEAFGAEAYLPDGLLNRAYLADKVFSNETELSKLNGMVHPAVANDFEKWVNEHQSFPVLIKEAALLIENESYKLLDELITVMAPGPVRMERILLRDIQRDKNQVQSIINSQIGDELRKNVSNYLIDNSGNKLLIPQVLAIHRKLLALSTSK